ncbi:hypothetical protein [Dactylosporangium darangshiense]|uniref:hypothetical protein n=1 Tax=Dactylosporangium darangshiense TaxID=579108 RepID=UPI0031E64671
MNTVIDRCRPTRSAITVVGIEGHSDKEGVISLPTSVHPGSSPFDIFGADGLEPLAANLPAAADPMTAGFRLA